MYDKILQKTMNFIFEIRYYNSYQGGISVASGVYVFKTSDQDSTSYNLKL